MPDPFSLPPETVTTGQLFMLLQELNSSMTKVAADQALLRADFERDRKDKADMVAAWKAGGTVLRMIKVLGGAVVAGYGIWKFFKGVWP